MRNHVSRGKLTMYDALEIGIKQVANGRDAYARTIRRRRHVRIARKKGFEGPENFAKFDEAITYKKHKEYAMDTWMADYSDEEEKLPAAKDEITKGGSHDVELSDEECDRIVEHLDEAKYDVDEYPDQKDYDEDKDAMPF